MPETKKVSVKATSKSKKNEISTKIDQSQPVWPHSLFTDYDVDLFLVGKHFRLYDKFGSHLTVLEKVNGVYFAVWAPNAINVGVVGDFNGWNREAHALNKRWDKSGIWEGFIPNVAKGDVYKYFVKGFDESEHEKGDPYARRWEHPPQTASIVWDTDYTWKDKSWLAKRAKLNPLNQAISVYEIHLGSWQRDPENPKRVLNCREIAKTLVPYVVEMGFTHVELMPVMEYPYFPSWGYQITGYFGASSRYGSPQDLMYLIEELHNANIAVILDWVPSHFPGDRHGLYEFDGTHLYEHADMRKGFHPDWKSYIFNYDRPEVRSFLISNATFWIDQYHADGLRVDAVASMLYFNFSREDADAATNEYGGSENLGAIKFLQDLNETLYGNFKGVQTIAEESSTFDGVTRPVYDGGLGFGMKWMMGWMNDTLKYFKVDPLGRKHHHNSLSFSMSYAFSENFMLPFSHDEVVHGKSPMLYKMPGDDWQKFANLRALYGYMFTHPGTKLLFMGNEFADTNEWNFKQSLDWHLLQYAPHKGMQETVKALNFLYRNEPALHDFNFSYEGFEWLDADNANESVFVYMRKGTKAKDTLVIALNFTPVVRENYKIGVPFDKKWVEIFNSDDIVYYGSGINNKGNLDTYHEGFNNQKFSINVTLPPLGMSVFKSK
ncbi:1,4-alpha-glucan branching protein GlgB [Pedobacter changchengzhani]|uniref:1,4-alpha-glucan branching enzyme GlgB n=1 Tax=Pedobacter changchengzhani TaxID=2529274 RepID=A0A4V3A083_9SPHI|nr:1,4-alpha-glucan branching protein GlgB [Pedobacter changchengzhani]TDG36673.1 1,4-alpha-glucan branching protein GlgB [Pedobacter changchengzhani]